MAYHDTPDSRTTSPSLSERVRSLTALRTRFSSASRTTLVDDLDAETVTAEESDHGSSAADRHKGASAAYPGEYVFDRLQPSKALGDRVDMIDRIAGNAVSYPVPVLMSMWRPIHDMHQENSQLEARRACFSLATSIAKLDAVSREALQQLYRYVAIAVPYELLQDQVRSLKALTGKGIRVDPFVPDITNFLIVSLPRQFRLVTDIRRQNKADLARDPTLSRRDPILSGLLSLVASINKLNPGVFQNTELSLLLQELFNIAEKTSSKRDMKDVVKILTPIVRTTGIPQDLQHRCVELLCAMSNAVEDVKEESRASIFFLLKSDSKDDIVQILLETLSLALTERHHTTVCGALAILLELIKNRGQDGLPRVTFSQFIEPFSHVHYGSRTTRNASLQTISDILADKTLQKDVLGSDWKFLVDTILTATGDERYEPGETKPLRIESHNRSQPLPDSHSEKDHSKQANLAKTILEHLQRIASSFNSLWFRLDKTQRSLVAKFYKLLVDVLPQKLLLHLIEDIQATASGKMSRVEDARAPEIGEERSPRTTYYRSMDDLIEMFMFEHRIPPLPYGRVMEGLRLDLQNAVDERNTDRIRKLANYIKKLLGEFKTIQGGGWQKAVELAQTVALAWKHSMPEDLEAALRLMEPLVYAEADEEDQETTRESDARSLYSAQHGMAKVTLALVDVFLHYLPHDPYPSTMLFEKLMEIASDRKLSASIRLPALRLLARIRCDQDYAIFITSDADSLRLAPYLRRTESTKHQLATFPQERSPANTPTRASRPDGTRELRRSRKSIDLTAKPAPTLPLWMYPGGPGLPQAPPIYPSDVVFVCNPQNHDHPGNFNISEWLSIAMDILQKESDWEVYSYVIVHLPSQLANPSLFVASVPAVKWLRSIVVGQLLDGKFFNPPQETHVMKGDVAFCLMQTLIILLGYAEHFSQGEQDELIKVFLHGMGTWERTNQICIQALAVACHAIPISVKRTIGAILLKLERYITTPNLTVDILELLGGIARVRQIYADLIQDDYRKVFAICIKFLESAREKRSQLALNSGTTRDYTSSRWSGFSTSSHTAPESRDRDDRQKDLPQYVFVLAYHVITIWFVNLKLPERSKHVGWISSKLAWKDSEGVERMEEQSQVTLDMMLRSAYSDLGETKPPAPFTEADGKLYKKTWLVGLSIVTVETAAKTGLSHVIKRQASGTTYATYLQNTAQLAAHDINRGEDEDEDGNKANVFPQHVFLQLNSSISPVPSPLEPICLPDDAIVRRALETFDRMDTVDGYRVGVVYVRDGQSTQAEVLSNTHFNYHFTRFLDGLGTMVRLQGATFNTQGLDTVSNQDGHSTYAWRDRLVEIVYHVPAMMPNLEHDSQYTNKKRHIGNNFVTIVWNESGLPYEFDMIASQFNSVNIVITPENSMARSDNQPGSYHVPVEGDEPGLDDPRYKIQTFTKPSFPRLSPCASAKLLPLSRLSAFVRQMALNSAIFSNVWSNRDDGEYVSSWRNRLREIFKLRERYANSSTVGESAEFSDARASRQYRPGDPFKGKVEMGGITEEDGILDTLDFSRWAGSMPTSDNTQIPGHGGVTGQNISHGN